ncbi:MAG TPA: sterol desaturase family protein [Mucilaginibacter sp.]|nr:sterol desaturase family protein [Mucilaginibacter sp.]
MHIFSSVSNVTDTIEQAFFLSVRFFLFAGSIFLFFYIWKRWKYWHLKIQQRFPDRKHIYREIRYSFYTVFIFGIVIVQVMWASKNRWTLVYYPIDKYGWPYYFFSITLMVFVHDTYFYWAHRLLHWKPLFKTVHIVHHRSLNPTPFSAYAFHPVEALVEIGIIPLIVFTIPYHVSALDIFSVYTLLMNIFGHMGYEFFSKGFVRNKFLKWHNTATNHNMHHRFIKCNYGLYFNIWDRLMKTNHPHYEEVYDQVIAQRTSGNNKTLNETVAEALKNDLVSEDELLN